MVCSTSFLLKLVRILNTVGTISVTLSKVNLRSECAEVHRTPSGRSARSSVLILMELIGVREHVGTAH